MRILFEIKYIYYDLINNKKDWCVTMRDYISSKFMSNKNKEQKKKEIKTIANTILQRNKLNIPYDVYLEDFNINYQSLLENARNFRTSMEYEKRSIFNGKIKIYIKSHLIGKVTDLTKVQHLLHEFSHGIYEISRLAKFDEEDKIMYIEIDKLKKHFSFIEIPELAYKENSYDILGNEESMEDQKNKEKFCEGFSHYLLNLPIKNGNENVILSENEDIDEICKKIIQYLQPDTQNS